MHTGSSEENHQQKKEAVIAMLSENWEEFIAALRSRLHTHAALPHAIQELVMLLSDIIYDDSSNGSIPYREADMFDAADEKGLLEKAKCIILKTHTLSEKRTDPIVHKDGLFVIQTHEQSTALDPVFKDLVDSVL